jgi:uncharacterized zinc-type alcohol dehydrogenase-like protein
MAVKLAAAMGAHVVVLTTSPSKIDDAKRLGAHDVVISTDKAAMKAFANSLDLLIDTVGTSHDLEPEFALLRRDGALCLLGGSPEPHHYPGAFSFIMKRKTLAGSLIGGIPETQEMLDFCAEHDIVADIEVIAASAINDAYERMLTSDEKYRFVIDIGTLHG